jgi:hypothetical protein
MAISQSKASAAKKHKRHRRKHRHAWNDKHWRWVPDGNGDWRVQGYICHHRHKPPRHHFRGPGKKRAARPAAAAAAVNRDPRPAGAYQGAFGLPQAVRLLERAGFGPTPGQAEGLVSLGLLGAVQSLTRPSGAAVLSGPAPVDDDGEPLAPADAWGHDHLWWLDRTVRSNQPLIERMALIFHDWFATSAANVSKPQQMIDQSNLFRGACFGSFLDLFKAETIDPAMLQWLNGVENVKSAPDTHFSHKLAGLAAYLAIGLPMRVVTVRAPGGYDTHSGQAEDLEHNLRETCEGLLAFQRDLEQRGLADRVMVEMWSEFGRRPEENGSQGTDHGAAGCAFVIGSKAKGEMVGEFPGLAKLDANDNLRVTSDFRGMYCSLLEQWLGHDAASIIPGAAGFARPTLVA